MAGYSGTPLAKKLGITGGMSVHASHAPAAFREALGPIEGVTWRAKPRPPIDLVVAFFTAATDVPARWPALTAAVGHHGVIWVAWPKKASGVPTDLTEDRFREMLLATGWVDVKVCAIDETWSGLKFVLRKELR